MKRAWGWPIALIASTAPATAQALAHPGCADWCDGAHWGQSVGRFGTSPQPRWEYSSRVRRITTPRVGSDLITPIAVLSGHTADVEDAEFSGDGRYLVTGGDDHKGILWNTATWSVETELVLPWRKLPGWIYSVAYSRDGRWIATGYTSSSYGASIVLWRVVPPRQEVPYR